MRDRAIKFQETTRRAKVILAKLWEKLAGAKLLALVAVLTFLSAATGAIIFFSKRAAKAEASWYNGSWSYRKQLFFDNLDQAENLSNFPVMIKLTSSNFDFSQAQTNGEDIRFTDSDGATPLSYEIESYDSSAQTAIIWVNVPQIDASSSTDHIYLYWGNASTTDGQNADEAWNSDYKGVWHLEDNTSSTTVADSSGNSNHLTASQNTTGYNAAGNIDSGFINMGTPHAIQNQAGSFDELYPTLKLDSNDYPIIAYYDQTQYDLIVVHCNDAECKSNDESVVAVDTTGSVGAYPSMQLDTSGYPVIAYYDVTNTAVKVVHCGDANCSAGNTINTVESAGSVGAYPILQLDTSGYPVIAYYDATNTAVKLAHCNDVNCDGVGESIVTVDNNESDGNNFHGTSMVLDASGYPVLSYYDATNTDVKLTHCGDANCSAGNTTVTVIASVNSVGAYGNLLLDGSGYPMIATYDSTGNDLLYVHCTDVNCSSTPTPVTVNASSGAYPWMQLNDSGAPIIIANYSAYPRLFVCSDADCSSDTEMYISLYNQYYAYYPVMELDSDGYPVFVVYSRGRTSTNDVYLYRTNPKLNRDYDSDFDFGTGSFSASMWFKSSEAPYNFLLTRYDSDQGFKIWLDYGGHPCFGIDDDSSWGPDDSACAAPANTNTNVDSGQATDPNPMSLQLDANGYPVIAYYDANSAQRNLELVHCNDVDCAGSNENTAVIDSTDIVGDTPSMKLDANGYPVIAYYDTTNTNLKVVHCGDANCSTGNTINTIADPADRVGSYPTLQLDANGYPVIAYYDTTNTAIKLVHCNDVNCGNDDETISTVDNTETDQPYVAHDNWMKLNTLGYPVMAYFNSGAADLKVAICGDANCASVTLKTVETSGSIGRYAALELDSNDYPVIAARNDTTYQLKLIHCGDATCASATSSFVTNGEIGEQGYYYINLKLNDSGYPVILHNSLSRWNHVLTICNDVNCSGDDESFTYIRHNADEPYYHSLQLDSNDYPVVAYSNSSDMNLMHATATTYVDTGRYDDGNWHHLTAVKNGTTDIRLYIDGAEVGSDVSTVADSTLTSDSAGLRLGDNFTTISGINYSTDNFNGRIDEVQIDSTARSAAWIAAQYKSESDTFITYSDFTETDPIAYWKLDEGYGSTIQDSTNNNYDGSLGAGSSAPTWRSEDQCLTGKCLSFDGGDDYANIPNTISDIKTVSFWVKPTTDTEYLLELNGSANITVSGGTISATGFSGAIIYVDGRPSSTLITGSWQHLEVTATSGIEGTGINLGKVDTGYLEGYLDDIKFYTYARSAAQVKADYAGGIGGGASKGFSAILGTNADAEETSPIIHWKLDEGTGASAYDTSGNNNAADLGVGNSSPAWTTGKYGKALGFDGNDYAVSSANPGTLTSGTYSLWIKPASINAARGWIDDGSGFDIFQWTGSLVYFRAGNQSSVSISSWSANTWHHAALTWNGSNYYGYLDGKLVTSGVQSGSRDGVISIGQVDNGFYYSGSIDDVRIYDYARTQKQIVEDMNAGHPGVGSSVSSAVGYWKFDEGYGSTTYDNSPRVNNGTLGTGASAPTWSNEGKFGEALSFDGSNDYVNIPNPANESLNFSTTDSFTLSAWVKTSTKGSGSPCIMTKRSSTPYYTLRMDTATGKAQFVIRDTSSNEPNLLGTTDISDNNWHHVVGIRNVLTDTLSIYVDGKLQNSTNDTTTATLTNSASLKFGTDIATGNWWSGFIDEVKIYPYALTADEIKLDYNQGQALVLGALSDNSSYEKNAANQEYCVPGDTTSCAAPVAEWSFDEGAGSSAYDKSGNGKTGTLTSGPTWITGKYGKAVKFDGGDDFVDVGTGPATVKTVEFWVNPTTTTEYPIDLNGTAYVWINAGTVTAQGFTSATIYVNGHVSSTVTAGSWQYVAVTTETGLNASDLDIGKIEGIGNYEGRIDQIRLFDYARTSAQIAWDYNRGGPVGWWKFDECQGTSAYDSSGFGNNGSISIGATSPQTSAGTCTDSQSTSAWYNGVTGKYNSSLFFDGSDDWITVTDNNSLKSGLTLSTWYKTSSMGYYNTMFNRGEQGNANGFVWFFFDTDDDQVWYQEGNASYCSLKSDAGTWSADNTWHHLTVTHDNSSNYVYFYKDGKRIGEGSCTWRDISNTTGYIGTYEGSSNSNYPIKGQLDDFKIFNYALTNTQVKNLYNQGAAVQFAPVTGSP